MGRKPVTKPRILNPETRAAYVEKIGPTLMQQGLKTYNMNELAQLIGVSKATLYKHFRSREEIFSEVVDRKIEQIMRFDDILKDQSISFRMRYEEAVQMGSIQMAGISNAFLLDLKRLFPDLWHKVMLFQEFVTASLEAFYKEGIEDGILGDHDPKFLALTDQIFISSLSDPEFLINNQLTLPAAIDSYFGFKRTGIFKE